MTNLTQVYGTLILPSLVWLLFNTGNIGTNIHGTVRCYHEVIVSAVIIQNVATNKQSTNPRKQAMKTFLLLKQFFKFTSSVFLHMFIFFTCEILNKTKHGKALKIDLVPQSPQRFISFVVIYTAI